MSKGANSGNNSGKVTVGSSYINPNTTNHNSYYKVYLDNDVVSFNKATTITVVMVGGGGAGGKSSHGTLTTGPNSTDGSANPLHGGGGGAGGAVTMFTYDVLPKVGYPLVVGAGGSAPGGNGGATTFLNYTAKGGQGGQNATIGNPGKGGAGTNGSVGGQGMHVTQTMIAALNNASGIPYLLSTGSNNNSALIESGHSNPYSTNSTIMQLGVGGAGGGGYSFLTRPPVTALSDKYNLIGASLPYPIPQGGGFIPIPGTGAGGSGGWASFVDPTKISGVPTTNSVINPMSTVAAFSDYGYNGSSGAVYIYTY